MNTQSSLPPVQPARRLSGLAFWGLALLALGYASQRRSLWADEFHSLHHAQVEGWSAFLDSVRTDNHPPLSFFLEKLSIQLFGPAEWALRLPSLLIGLLFLWMLRHSIGLLAPQSWAQRAPWMALASSYYLVIFSEARMYALLALASLGLMLTLAGVLDGTRARAGRWWLALWIAIGLHSHYYFFYELGVTLGFLGLVWALQPQTRKQFRDLLMPALLGGLLFLPWGYFGFWVQLNGDLPPGRAAGNLSALRDGFAHMFHWNASLGGDWAVRYVAIPGTLFAVLAGLLGLLRLAPLLRSKGPGGVQSLMLLSYGIGLPLLTWVISRFSERSTFGWRYLAGAAIAVQIIATIGLAGTSRLRRGLWALLMCTMGAISWINLSSGGHEDHRQLFEHILAHGRSTDAIMDKPPYDPQPLQEESSWGYYVARYQQRENPELPTEFGYDQLTKAQQSARVWVWFRDQYHPWVRRELLRTHDLEQQWQMGPALTLHLFSKSSPPKTQ